MLVSESQELNALLYDESVFQLPTYLFYSLGNMYRLSMKLLDWEMLHLGYYVEH